MKIILASKSPRRLEILRKHGIEPVVIPSEVDETLPDGIDMREAVKSLALRKAEASYNAIRGTADSEDAIIIGSDTIVYKDEIMGKPKDFDDAFRMLSTIRNTEHYVATGVALINTNTGESKVFCDVTTVYCKDYSDMEIREYIENTKPFDKAGSYAIQGEFGKYIDHIDGDYENVVGLPFHILEEQGVTK